MRIEIVGWRSFRGRPDEILSIDPAATVAKCISIYERLKKDHSFCQHCPQLIERVRQSPEVQVQLRSLLEAERSKPWGEPCAGPTDTMPPPAEEVVGFEVIE